jgi:hypothetical protein
VALIEWPCDSLFSLLPPNYISLYLRELNPEEALHFSARSVEEGSGGRALEEEGVGEGEEEEEEEEEDGEFALPPMDGPRVVRAEAVGDRWDGWLSSVPLDRVS